MEALARAANEAATPEAAMQECVARICNHGAWALGRVAAFAPGQTSGKTQHSQWHCADPARYAAFMQLSDNQEYTGRHGVFLHRVLSERRPVWLPDFSTTTSPP